MKPTLEGHWLAQFYGNAALNSIRRGESEYAGNAARCSAHWALVVLRARHADFMETWLSPADAEKSARELYS